MEGLTRWAECAGMSVDPRLQPAQCGPLAPLLWPAHVLQGLHGEVGPRLVLHPLLGWLQAFPGPPGQTSRDPHGCPRLGPRRCPLAESRQGVGGSDEGGVIGAGLGLSGHPWAGAPRDAVARSRGCPCGEVPCGGSLGPSSCQRRETASLLDMPRPAHPQNTHRPGRGQDMGTLPQCHLMPPGTLGC